MPSFREALATQRWDDHRYYHHSRINQTLHLFSAISFLAAYATCVVSPALAALVGWLLAMVSRQAGHFFFEPKGYDTVNCATHEHKEAIKVGYNLRRKTVLLAVWAVAPVLLWIDPTLFGVFRAQTGAADFLRRLGEVWLAVGVGGLLFRTAQLAFIKDPKTGLVWLTKILTDPFHDVQLYYKAPLHLLRGERLDPMMTERRA